MWVETTDGELVNLDGVDVLKVVKKDEKHHRVAAWFRATPDFEWALYDSIPPDEADAALRRIRDALSRGAKFLSLRETDSEGEAQAEELRNVLKHCLYRLEDNVQCLQSAGYYDERDATKIAVMRAKVVLGGLHGG